jgi:hypothetical protein
LRNYPSYFLRKYHYNQVRNYAHYKLYTAIYTIRVALPRGEFIPWFNDRFSVIPAKEGDVNRTLITREIESLPSIFSVKSTRKVMNDFTISFKGDFYQLRKNQPVTVCRKDTILVEERLDSTIHLRHDRKGKYLNFVKLSARPLKISSPKITALTTSVPKESWKPAANHPWKNDPHMKKIIAQQESIKQSL